MALSVTSTTHSSLPLSSKVPFIPPELVDIILSHAHADTSILAACSLVCKAWLPSARFHMFPNVSLNGDNISPFIRILNKDLSTMPHFIRHLEAKDTLEGGRWLPELFPCLSSLPCLVSISITSSFDTTLSDATLFTLCSFDALVELKLAECTFDDFSQVQRLLCSFPVLEKLYLEADWPESCSVSPTDAYPSPHLRELYLRCEASNLLDWFLMLPEVAPVDKLTLHGIDAHNLPVVSRYLQTRGSSLSHLTIFPSGSLYDALCLCCHVDLSHHTRLRYLKLAIDCDRSNLLMAHDLLKQIRSPIFEEVELSFYSIRQVGKTADQWASLDSLLAKQQFSLTHVTVSAMIAANMAKETLPQCQSRGVLSVRYR